MLCFGQFSDQKCSYGYSAHSGQNGLPKTQFKIKFTGISPKIPKTCFSYISYVNPSLLTSEDGLYVGVRDLPERDIWSLRVGWGVGGKSMFLPPSPPSPPLAWTPKRRYLALFGAMWRYLALFGAIWALFGRIF